MAAPVETRIRRVERWLIEGTSDTDDVGLPERMAHHAVPGVGLAVIANGEIAYERSYGVKEAGRPGPVTATTRFQACSISKPVAVLGMLRLVERGLLDLDLDVNDLLTSWRVPPNASWQPRVTLRQIASHSAGLTVSGFPGYAAGIPPDPDTDPDGQRSGQHSRSAGRHVPGRAVPLCRRRNDSAAAGSGGRHRPAVPGAMRDLVLEPLGMSSSDYAQPLPLELHPEAATAHRSDGTPVPGGWHVYPELAAAGLWTTPGDLARYAIAVQRSYHGAPDAVLGAELAGQMLTPQIDSTPRMGGLEFLGLGLFLGGRPEPKTFGHSGGNEGFKCHLLAHRDAGWGAAVMTNGDRGHALVQEILNALGRELEWPDYEASEPPADTESGAALDAFTGVYELRPGATIAVSRRGDDLCVGAVGQPEVRFVQVSESEFGSFALDATLRFTRTADQGVTELILCQNGDELACRRIGD